MKNSIGLVLMLALMVGSVASAAGKAVPAAEKVVQHANVVLYAFQSEMPTWSFTKSITAKTSLAGDAVSIASELVRRAGKGKLNSTKGLLCLTTVPEQGNMTGQSTLYYVQLDVKK